MANPPDPPFALELRNNKTYGIPHTAKPAKYRYDPNRDRPQDGSRNPVGPNDWDVLDWLAAQNCRVDSAAGHVLLPSPPWLDAKADEVAAAAALDLAFRNILQAILDVNANVYDFMAYNAQTDQTFGGGAYANLLADCTSGRSPCGTYFKV